MSIPDKLWSVVMRLSLSFTLNLPESLVLISVTSMIQKRKRRNVTFPRNLLFLSHSPYVLYAYFHFTD